MRTTQFALEYSRQATIGSDGTVAITIGPNYPFETWQIEQLTVSGNSAVTPLVRVYRGAVSVTTFLEGTNAGNGDISDTKHSLRSGDALTVVWSEGTPGAQVVAIVRGIRTVRGDRAYAFR